jgi:hypothetical protein
MKHHILCINSGTSSMKFSVYGLGEAEEMLAEGVVERIALPGGWLPRTHGPFWSFRTAPVLFWSVIVTNGLATIAAVYGWFMVPVQDPLKLVVHRIFNPTVEVLLGRKIPDEAV